MLEQTIPYVYATSGWKDRLTSYNGESIVYDSLGNPTTYRGHTLVWGKIKQLEVFDTNTFAYNAEGIRVRKNNITYELDGTKILREVRPDGVIEYYYGNNGIVDFKYNNVEYYYQKNQQGDIVAVYTASGTKVAEYVYDAWGKCTVVLDTNGIGTINPFRYRRYYYDTETGLYYLQSRYYDPEVGRFINADNLVSTGQGILGHNMFAYCRNNPVSRKDAFGFTDRDNMDDDSNLLDDEKLHAGGKLGNGGQGGSGAGHGGGKMDGSTNKVHGNSSSSTKPQHGYEIYEKSSGDVVKTGISGQELKNGTSPRANSQVNKFNAKEGEQKYEARVVETNMPSRGAALRWERMNTYRLWDAGHSLSLHYRPNPRGERKCF